MYLINREVQIMEFLDQWFSGERGKMLQVDRMQFIFKKYVFLHIYKCACVYTFSTN